MMRGVALIRKMLLFVGELPSIFAQAIQSYRQRPLIVMISTIVAVLVAVLAIYSDSGAIAKYPLFPTNTPPPTATTAPTATPTATHPPLPTPTPLAFRPAAEGETLIVIAKFAYLEGADDTDPAGEIAIAIREAAKTLDFTTLRVEVEPTQIGRLGREAAESLGRQYDAAIVIWGEVSTVAVTTNFLNLSEPKLPAAYVNIRETERTQSRQELSGIPLFSEYVTKNLPQLLVSLAFFAVGNSYYQAQNFAEARVAFEKSVSSWPKEAELEGLDISVFALALLSQIDGNLIGQIAGNFVEAITRHDKTIKSDRTDVVAYNDRGIALSSQKQYEEAIASYDKAIELDSAYTDVYINRGNALRALAQYKEAIASYDKAIEFDPASAVAYINRGNAFRALEQYEEAIASYDKAIELDPAYTDVYINRGNALRALAQYKEAIASYDKAIEFDPASAVAYINRGNALRALEQYEEAIASYDKAIELDPAYTDVYNNRGVAFWDWGITYARQGDFAQAAEFMQVLVDYEQENNYPDAGKHSETVEEYRRRAAAGE